MDKKMIDLDKEQAEEEKQKVRNREAMARK